MRSVRTPRVRFVVNVRLPRKIMLLGAVFLSIVFWVLEAIWKQFGKGGNRAMSQVSEGPEVIQKVIFES